jgi:LysM repeat protein
MQSNENRILTLSVFLVGAMLVSSCQISLSKSPQGTPTLIPTGFFTTPNAGGLSIQTIAAFGTQTAAARTAGPVTGTPATVAASPTPNIISGTPGTPTNAIGGSTSLPFTLTPGGPASTSLAPGVRPTTYTLQPGEFPYCIARRFDVDPRELLSLNGISSEVLLSAGTSLKIPQTGNPFLPLPRALRSHPTTYVVASGDQTMYGVACIFGDVDPAAIAQANGLAVSADLTTGQQLQIP